MRFIRGMLSAVLISGLLYLGIYNPDLLKQIEQTIKWPEFNLNSSVNIENVSHISQTKQEQGNKSLPQVNEQIFDVVKIGMIEQELEQIMGKPDRIDPTPYGYEWWVFNQDWSEYIQIGVQEGKVVTYYTNSPAWGWKDISPGMIGNEWSGKLGIKPEVSFVHNLGFYTFALTKTEQEERPLLLENNTAVQLYIDVHERHRISGLRVMDLEILLLQRPYALKYSGELPETPLISDGDWLEIARANEQQIFELVNITRRKHQLTPLDWSEHVASVARQHSADMLLNNYFDHYSNKYGDLVQRLNHGEVVYSAAGENIAWNYIDAPDAHEGWLNSLGHRKNVFKEEFTHLGVGIVEKYYTQNFIKE